jgi:hypothetical protein
MWMLPYNYKHFLQLMYACHDIRIKYLENILCCLHGVPRLLEKKVCRELFFPRYCFWWTRGTFFVFILLCRPSEDSLQWSTIPNGSPSEDWQSTVGWGDCRIQTRDCRFTVWCCYQWATTAPYQWATTAPYQWATTAPKNYWLLSGWMFARMC